MSKAHRGKGIRDQVAHGRGTCPVCSRKNVKTLYEMEEAEQKFKICKTCKASIKHGKKKLPVVDIPKPKVEEAAPVAAEAAAEAPAETAAAEETPASEEAAPATEE